MKTSRRNFLKSTSLITGATALGGLTALGSNVEGPTAKPTAKPRITQTRKSRDYDLQSPQLWGDTALDLLHKHMVLGRFVHRDVYTDPSNLYDLVYTRRPGQFGPYYEREPHKLISLNEHFWTRFTVFDQMDFETVVDGHLDYSMKSIAESIDYLICEKILMNNAFVSSTPRDALIMGQLNLNGNKCYYQGRFCTVSPEWEDDIQFEQRYSSLPDKYLGHYRGFECIKYNIPGLAFHRESIGLCMRAMPIPPEHFGTRAGQYFKNDLAARVILSYNVDKSAMDVNIDILAGIDILDITMLCRLDIPKV